MTAHLSQTPVGVRVRIVHTAPDRPAIVAEVERVFREAGAEPTVRGDPHGWTVDGTPNRRVGRELRAVLEAAGYDVRIEAPTSAARRE